MKVTLLGTPEAPFYEEDKTLFEFMLGKFPKGKRDAEKLAEGIGAILRGRLGHSIFNALTYFLETSIQERVITEYHAGTISAGLTELLKIDTPNREENSLNDFKAWRDMIRLRIQEGKADFSLFKGPNDTGENWLMRYVINPYIVSAFMPENVIVTEAKLNGRKAEAAQKVKEILAAALDETADQHGRGPVSEKTISGYGDRGRFYL